MNTTTHVFQCQPSANAKTMSFICPWCPAKRGKPVRHTHGIVTGPELHHRISHCHAPAAPRGYFVTIHRQ